MIRKLLLSLCFVVCLSGQVGNCSEQGKEYRITETQLTALEQKFAALANSNKLLLNESAMSKTDLTTARSELERYRLELEKQQKLLLELKADLMTARTDLETTQSKLRIANELLTKYAEEEKQTRKRLEYQRNGWALLAVAGIVARYKN